MRSFCGAWKCSQIITDNQGTDISFPGKKWQFWKVDSVALYPVEVLPTFKPCPTQIPPPKISSYFPAQSWQHYNAEATVKRKHQSLKFCSVEMWGCFTDCFYCSVLALTSKGKDKNPKIKSNLS